MPTYLSSRLRKTLAWLALCAMCLGAAAPTVSRWLTATAQTADLVAICNAYGQTLVPASELPALAQNPQPGGDHHGGSPNGQHSPDDGDCCGYCTLLHHSPGVPVAAAAVALHALLLPEHYANAGLSAPALRAVRQPHMPQAPPLALA